MILTVGELRRQIENVAADVPVMVVDLYDGLNPRKKIFHGGFNATRGFSIELKTSSQEVVEFWIDIQRM